MNEHKRRRAEQLFDAFGELDDKYIAEAQSARLRRTSWRALLPAAAILLCLTLLISIPLSRTNKDVQSPFDDAEQMPDALPSNPDYSQSDKPSQDPAYGEDEASAALDIYATLELCKNVQAQPLAEVLDGTAKLIWQYGNEVPRYVALTDKNFSSLVSSLSTNAGEASGDREDIKIWICYADGRVVTPLLKPSAGNIGYGTLFDYTDEVIPSQQTVNLIYSIITQST